VKLASLRLPRENLIRLLGGLAFVSIFSAALVLPQTARLRALERETAELGARIEEQEVYRPVYEELMQTLQLRSKFGVQAGEAGSSLRLEQIADIPGLLADLAAEHGLAVGSVTPVPGSLTGTGLLSVTCVLEGELAAFREFLLDLGGLPYLRRIEELRVEHGSSGTVFRIDLWLALEGGGAS
jgi:hypothetical protein